jgi:hypothetical protein
MEPGMQRLVGKKTSFSISLNLVLDVFVNEMRRHSWFQEKGSFGTGVLRNRAKNGMQLGRAEIARSLLLQTQQAKVLWKEGFFAILMHATRMTADFGRGGVLLVPHKFAFFRNRTKNRPKPTKTAQSQKNPKKPQCSVSPPPNTTSNTSLESQGSPPSVGGDLDDLNVEVRE